MKKEYKFFLPMFLLVQIGLGFGLLLLFSQLTITAIVAADNFVFTAPSHLDKINTYLNLLIWTTALF